MFKDLDEEAPHQTPGNLAALGDLLKQHFVHDDMEATAKRIQM
jgi:hypothetical protein